MRQFAYVFGSTEPTPSKRKVQVAWARRPLVTPLGRAVGVALVRGCVSVALETSRGLVWVPAEQVADAEQLEMWARTGF